MYVLITYYNAARKDHLLAMTVAGLAALCGYGWYKWSNELQGLLTVDYIIITITILFCLGIYIKYASKKGALGHLQGIITLLTMAAFILLGFKVTTLGWVALLLSHLLLGFFYHKRKAYYFVTLQAISSIIATVKIYNVQMA